MSELNTVTISIVEYDDLRCTRRKFVDSEYFILDDKIKKLLSVDFEFVNRSDRHFYETLRKEILEILTSYNDSERSFS